MPKVIYKELRSNRSHRAEGKRELTDISDAEGKSSDWLAYKQHFY